MAFGAAHIDSFAHDAAEYSRAAHLSASRCVQSLALARANFANTQLRITQAEALISAADRLILALDQELISRPDSSAADEELEPRQENDPRMCPLPTRCAPTGDSNSGAK